MLAVRDLTGQRFGKLLVLEQVPNRGGQRYWLARCDCGQVRAVYGGSLTRGRSKSCGCRRAEVSAQCARTHGATVGRRPTVEYRIWVGMKSRCSNPNNPAWARYGGRRITVCPAWEASFPQFLADMGPRPSPQHSLERVNNERGYEPDNCIWADKWTQANNTRTNQFITYQGERMTIAQACRRVGLRPHMLYNRMRTGWTLEEALCMPWGGGRVKLTREKVQDLWAMQAQGMRLIDIAQQLGVALCTVSDVVHGRTWRHVGPHGAPNEMTSTPSL